MTLLLCAAVTTLAQAPSEAPKPALIENTGAPMHVPFTCGDEEVHALALTCTQRDPCPVYLELSAIESVGSRLFLAGNLHTESTTVASILLASDDGGKTWQEPHQRIRGAGFDQVRFVDLENGFASGHILGAIPHDPFFLLTRDGGRTWHPRPIGEEGRPGTIDWFTLDSKDSGTVAIDRGAEGQSGRYEIYDTQTGGETWSIREATDVEPKAKQAPAPSHALHLRADRATRSYRLEKHEGDRWAAVASFVVQVGDCKESETVIPEPPPPTDPPQGEPKSKPLGSPRAQR